MRTYTAAHFVIAVAPFNHYTTCFVLLWYGLPYIALHLSPSQRDRAAECIKAPGAQTTPLGQAASTPLKRAHRETGGPPEEE